MNQPLTSLNGFQNKLEPGSAQSSSSSEFISKITLAATLEREGKILEALKLYQEVINDDQSNGTYSSIAAAAVEQIKKTGLLTFTPQTQQVKKEQEVEVSTETLKGVKANYQRKPKFLLKWFYDLPISKKFFIVLVASEFLSLALVGASSWLDNNHQHEQLSSRAESELVLTGEDYNIKIDQMGFGFRGQSENPVIISSAKTLAQKKVISPGLSKQVYQTLLHEAQARGIEYATLVSKDLRIIANANRDRRGEIFNPDDLVTEVLHNSQQIKTSAIVSGEELAKEAPILPPGFKKKDALIRWVVTPVFDPATKVAIGALVSGDLVNDKLPIVENTLKAFDGGYSAVCLRKSSGDFELATALEQSDKGIKPVINLNLPNVTLLEAADRAQGMPVTSRLKIGNETYTTAAKALLNYSGEPVAILVRGTSEAKLNALQRDYWLKLGVSFAVVILFDIGLVRLLADVLVRPLRPLQHATQQFAQGEREVRSEVLAEDEIGQLTLTWNQMADSIVSAEQSLMSYVASETKLEADARWQESEAHRYQQAMETLQQEIINLLLEIEGAQEGDLTVQASVTDGELHAVADAINAIVSRNCQFLFQVKQSSAQVIELVQNVETSVGHFSQAAGIQAAGTSEALQTVREINDSIRSVGKLTEKASVISRSAVLAAKDGNQATEQLVACIDKIRVAFGATTQKVERLAESSQEISRIVDIISEIAQKTNFVAFNAMVAAVNAGEHGRVFLRVADEVCRLAEQAKSSTKEIEQLVSRTQKNTSEVLRAAESGATEVNLGNQLVLRTKRTLQGLAGANKSIDTALESISASTLAQTSASEKVNGVIQEVTAIAHDTASEAKAVSGDLESLFNQLQILQSSVSLFRLEK